MTQLVRKMRRFNPIPNMSGYYTGGYRNITLDYVIEDPIMRESRNSFLHQMIDVVAYCARQLYEPNGHVYALTLPLPEAWLNSLGAMASADAVGSQFLAIHQIPE